MADTPQLTAVRDALPFVSGSQPVLFVFSAGNAGGGDNNGQGGNPEPCREQIGPGGPERPPVLTTDELAHG